MTAEQPPRVWAEIPCGYEGCGRTAAVIELIPRGAAYADGRTDILHELNIPGLSELGTFRLSGFLPFTGFSTHVARYEAVVAAVRGAGDRVDAVLHALAKEYAPYFCATCDRSYCEAHWNLHAVFDYGFDYYTGACLFGHKKFIDH
ncbi:hypothetical protein OHB26_03270 [Nocardia sp. NBC_01503]|uniref:hypothetical protein n=1 Tax=Nocardia sp. NBC_01503 TaxID=2975997 RepID=UPI002E7AE001|nr:hypothetical protein [Nocardia sp. NBC_01503]WTL33285.1 hypothetical protein OHB26_03270 [Nocardia sp. NBC_01503]